MSTLFTKLWSRLLRNQWRVLLISFPAVFATGYVVWRMKQNKRGNDNSIERESSASSPAVNQPQPPPSSTTPPGTNQSNDEVTDEQPIAGTTLPLSTMSTSINPLPSPTDSGFQGSMPSPADEPKSSDAEYPTPHSLPPTPCSLPVGSSPTSAIDTTVIRGGRARATIQLPIDIIGRFIGRTGKNIKSLMAESGAQIHVQQKNLSKEDSIVPCILQGTQAQINKAVDLICLRHPEVSVPSPQVYVTPLPIYSSSLGSTSTSSWDFTLKQPPIPSTTFLAIVTYIEKLNRVWLVPYSSTQLLEELHQSMATAYKTDEATPTGDKEDIIGKSCAVRVNEVYWLRGRVVETNEESQYEVRLLDYGSSVIVPLASLRPLRKEHTLIPVQSLPYLLSNIQPIDSDGEDGMLVLQALVEGVVLEAHPTGRRSSEDTPYIELYTQCQHGTSADTQTFINRELVNQGFAIWREIITTANDSAPFSSSTGTSDDNTPITTITLATPINHITTITADTDSDPIIVPRSVSLSDLLSNRKQPVVTGLADGDMGGAGGHSPPAVVTSSSTSANSVPGPAPMDPMKILFGDQLHILSHSSA